MKKHWITIELASDGSTSPDAETIEFHKDKNEALACAEAAVRTGGCSHVGVFELVGGYRSEPQAVSIEVEK